MSSSSANLSGELNWLDRLRSKLRGSTPADTVLNKIIGQCANSWRPWLNAKDKVLVQAAVLMNI